MPTTSPRFALNHMTTPGLSPEAFFALAGALRLDAVEIRNDLPGNAILDGAPASRIRSLAEAAGVRIISINALQRFDDWRAERANQAVALADYAAACGAEALVLVPTNDGSRPDRLFAALEGLKAILQDRGLRGLVEPLGFADCSLRLKSTAAEAIRAVGGTDTFRLVQDTFHHHLAGETRMFPELTGLVHISGVDDAGIAVDAMRDRDRGLVTERDRLGNVPQIRELRRAGYAGYLSFESFSRTIHALEDPKPAIATSMALLGEAVSVATA
ncbi:MAG: TIM barrel protein [Amaricoccus sp.]|uniref:TIM barrel protein n=1 Tax=Amaricoccus sp. TaxID=1872485 RepID=UPI0039E3CB03